MKVRVWPDRVATGDDSKVKSAGNSFRQLAKAAIVSNCYRHGQRTTRLHFGGGERPGGRRSLLCLRGQDGHRGRAADRHSVSYRRVKGSREAGYFSRGGGCRERVAHGRIAHEVEGQGLAGPRRHWRRLEGEVGRELFPSAGQGRHSQQLLSSRSTYHQAPLRRGRTTWWPTQSPVPEGTRRSPRKGRRPSLRLLPPVQGFPRSRIFLPGVVGAVSV